MKSTDTVTICDKCGNMLFNNTPTTKEMFSKLRESTLVLQIIRDTYLDGVGRGLELGRQILKGAEVNKDKMMQESQSYITKAFNKYIEGVTNENNN